MYIGTSMWCSCVENNIRTRQGEQRWVLQNMEQTQVTGAYGSRMTCVQLAFEVHRCLMILGSQEDEQIMQPNWMVLHRDNMPKTKRRCV